MSMNMLSRFIAPLQRRVMSMIARGVIKAVKENKGLQRYQMTLLAEETFDELEMVGHYGFISSPPPGSEGVVVFPGGDRSHGIVVGTENRQYRLKILANGEVAIYDKNGQYVHIKSGGVVEVKANTKVLATCPLFETSGNAKVGGNLEVIGTSLLTGLATAPAGVTSTGALTGATIASTGGTPIADLGAKVNEIKTAHNTHKHAENGTGGGITDPADVQVS